MISGEDVCGSVVFGSLIGVFVFSVVWTELLMTSAISCPLWSSVYECHKVECAFTSPVRTECGILYLCVCCFVLRECAVSRTNHIHLHYDPAVTLTHTSPLQLLPHMRHFVSLDLWTDPC